jgi:hypothetical protein
MKIRFQGMICGRDAGAILKEIKAIDQRYLIKDIELFIEHYYQESGKLERHSSSKNPQNPF